MTKNRNKNAHGGKRLGAGRKPTPDDERRVLLPVRIPQALRLKLDEWSAANKVTRTQAIEEAIRRLLRRS